MIKSLLIRVMLNLSEGKGPWKVDFRADMNMNSYFQDILYILLLLSKDEWKEERLPN